MLPAGITVGSTDTTTLADIYVHSACGDDDGDDDDDDDDDRCLFQRSSQMVAEKKWQFWLPTFFLSAICIACFPERSSRNLGVIRKHQPPKSFRCPYGAVAIT